MTHRLNAVLLALILLVGAPYYWLFLQNPSRDASPQPVTMTELHTLAGSRPGPRPENVEMTLVGWRRVPGNLYAAGGGMKRKLLSVISFRLPVAGTGPVVIDTGTSQELATMVSLQQFRAERQASVDNDLRAAGVILVTDEQADHLGGLAMFARQPDSAVALTHARLNAEQVPAATADDHIPWPDGLLLRPAFPGGRPVAVAPGVVVIPAPGPSPGSQMVYVHLRDGREYLFAGDIAPFAVNFLELRTHSNLLNKYAAPEDRAAVMRWLVTIKALKREAPGLIVVPGHDYEWIVDPHNGTGITVVDVMRPPAKAAGS